MNKYYNMNKKLVFYSLCVFFVISVVQAEFTEKGLKCVKEIGTTNEKLRPLLFKSLKDTLTGDDLKLVENFVVCSFKDYMSENKNELIVDEKLKTHVADVFKVQMGGKQKLAELLADDCIKHCKDVRGDTREQSMLKISKCLMNRFLEYTKE